MTINKKPIRRPSLRTRAKGYLNRAQVRARRRKSPWNLLLVPSSVLGIGATWYLLFKLMWRLHVFIYPDHTDSFGEFWNDGIGFQEFISSFLLLFPLLFSTMPIGLMFANMVVWLVPPARKALDREAEGLRGGSFPETMAELWRVSKLVFPIGLLLSFVGALTLSDLR